MRPLQGAVEGVTEVWIPSGNGRLVSSPWNTRSTPVQHLRTSMPWPSLPLRDAPMRKACMPHRPFFLSCPLVLLLVLLELGLVACPDEDIDGVAAPSAH